MMALPKVLRFISNWYEDTAEVSFDLVVRTPAGGRPVYTYGGGRVAVAKPYTDVQMQVTLDNAVRRIIEEGNDAFSRERPEGKNLLADPPRMVKLHIDQRNEEDMTRGDR